MFKIIDTRDNRTLITGLDKERAAQELRAVRSETAKWYRLAFQIRAA